MGRFEKCFLTERLSSLFFSFLCSLYKMNLFFCLVTLKIENILKTNVGRNTNKGSFTDHEKRNTVVSYLIIWTSYCILLLKRLSPQTTRGAKKVQGVKGLSRLEDLSRWSPFSGGPDLFFYYTLIMTAAFWLLWTLSPLTETVWRGISLNPYHVHC